MDAESNLAENVAVASNNGSTSGEPTDPAVLKEKVADELKSAATLKGGGDGPADVPIEKDDLLERLDKIDACSDSSKTAASTNDVDMENDDLIQRLEAIEKGEECEQSTTSAADEKKEENSLEVNHQNGLEKLNEAESKSVDDQEDLEEKMEVDGTAEKKDDVSSSDNTTPAVVDTTPNGSAGPESEEELPSSSAKRRHSEDCDDNVEPSSKKPHVENNEQGNGDGDDDAKQTSDDLVQDAQTSSMSEKPDEISVPPNDADSKSELHEPDTIEKKPESENIAAEDEKAYDDSAPPPVPHEEADSAASTTDAEPKEKEPSPDENTEPLETTEADAKEEIKSSIAEDISTENDSALSEKQDSKVQIAEPDDPSHDKENTREPSKETDKISDVPTDAAAENAPAAASKEKDDKSLDTPDSKYEEEPREDEVKSTTVEEPAVSESAAESTPNTPEEISTDNKVDEKPKEAEPTSEKNLDIEADTKPEEQQEDQQPSSSSVTGETKTDEAISSSSEPKEESVLSSTENTATTPSESLEKPTETETVTSSDETPSVAETPASHSDETDANADASIPTASTGSEEKEQTDEAMEVDSEPVVEEPSASVQVSEQACVKKIAYECTKDKEVVDNKPEEKGAEITDATIPIATEQESTTKVTEAVEQMEVDSAAPSQSKTTDADVTESTDTGTEKEGESKEEASTAADSQSETTSAHNKNMDATTESSLEQTAKLEVSKSLDDSIECSLPTSSSDKLADRLKQRLDLISNGSSTPTNAAVSSSNVYNSTPIQKQFEISSENVSKIAHSVDNSRQEEDDNSAAITAENSVAEEKEATAVASTSSVTASKETAKDSVEVKKDVTGTTKEDSSLKTESSEVDSCTASSALNTADEINMYANNARKFNGISSTSGSELEEKSSAVLENITTTSTATTTVNKLDLTPTMTSEDAVYEVSVWFDGSELQFLSIEKMYAANSASTSQDSAATTDSSKQSSNGSVASIGPFSLPPTRTTADSALSHSSTSSPGLNQTKTSVPKMKHTVKGAKALATLMIDEFMKIKKALSKDEEVVVVESETHAEKATPSKASKSRPTTTPAKKTPVSSGARGQKRSRTESEDKPVEDDDAAKGKPVAKQAKKTGKSTTPTAESSTKSSTDSSTKTATSEPATESPESSDQEEEDDDYQCCLARWSDRKYYAGKVTGPKGDKFMILFEDGASKALAKETIVFGEKDTLPLIGHSVHALTGGDTYETGIVQEIKRNSKNRALYVVKIGDSTKVEVTASDMYLNEEQARLINKACKAAEDEKNGKMQSPQTTGKRGSATNTPVLQTPEDKSTTTSEEKGSRSTRSKRGAEKPTTPSTPEAGYSGGAGKKTRRGRRLS